MCLDRQDPRASGGESTIIPWCQFRGQVAPALASRSVSYPPPPRAQGRPVHYPLRQSLSTKTMAWAGGPFRMTFPGKLSEAALVSL